MDEHARILEIAGMTLDSSRHEAFLVGHPLGLTRTEFCVLLFLLQSDGRSFSREEIIAAVQGEDYPVAPQALNNHIQAIRRKLGDNGRLIETVRGVGYRRRVS
jgi:two-component system, OmpR family, alkaline phosphatase synthesis response regulator PhoP